MTEPDECGACGEPCRLVVTEGGLRRYLELSPHPSGNHMFITRPDGTIRVRVLSGGRMPAPDGKGYRMHRCPGPVIGPPCATCGKPMHARLAALLGWKTHPGWACDQGENRRPADPD